MSDDQTISDAAYYARFDPDTVGTMAPPVATNPVTSAPAQAQPAPPAPEPMIGADPGLEAMRARMVETPAAPQPDAHANEDAIYLRRFNPYPNDPQPPQPPETFMGSARRAAGRAVLPTLAGFAIGGPVGGAVGGLSGAGLGIGAGLVGSYAVDKAQDYTLKSLPQAVQEGLGQDERTRFADEAQHPYGVDIGGTAPMLLTGRPGGFARTALPSGATLYQSLAANPVTHKLVAGGLMGGIELGQELATGQRPDFRRVATSTAVGMFLDHPTRFGETLSTWGGRFRPTIAPEAAAAVDTANVPTVAQAGDLKVMGPGITEEVFQGTQAMHPDAEMAAQETARQEAALTTPPPGPDLHDVARRLDPETFQRYDELSAQRDTFRKTIADAANPPDDVMAEATAKREALDAQLAEVPTSGAGRNLPEARRLRAQVREAQRAIDDLQVRRDAFAAGQAVDTPEIAAARQHLMAIDYEMRDLSPAVSAAYRRAADHAASETVEPAPLPEDRTGTPPPDAGLIRFYHGEKGNSPPTSGGSRYITPDAIYARDFRSMGVPNRVHYVDLRPDEVEPHGGLDEVQRYPQHFNAPEHIAQRMQPYTFPDEASQPPAPGQFSAMTDMLAAREGGAQQTPEPRQPGAAAAPEPGEPANIGSQPANSGAEPSPTAAPSPQTFDIAADIARQLIAAGRPADEARAAGALLAARYKTRADRFKGELGTAEDVYRATAPSLVGPDGRRIAGPPPQARSWPSATRPEPIASKAPSERPRTSTATQRRRSADRTVGGSPGRRCGPQHRSCRRPNVL